MPAALLPPPGGALLALFALTAALLAYHAGRELYRARAGLGRRLRREALPLLGTAALAALVRLFYAPAAFQTLGLDSWLLSDALKLSGDWFGAPEAPRSVAHAALFGLHLGAFGVSLPGVFYFNFAVSVLTAGLGYAALRLAGQARLPAFAGAAVAASAPAAVAAAGGVLDNALAAFFAALFLAAWYALLRSPGPRRFALASLAAALAGQARQEGFALLALYAALLWLARRRLPARLKTPRRLWANAAFAALCLPYGLTQVLAYINFHGAARGTQPWSGFLALPGEAVSNLARGGFAWLYDGRNLTALAWAAAAWAAWRAWRARDPQPAAWAPAGLFLLYLAVFVPVARYSPYMPWYPAAAAPCFFLAVWLALCRYESRRILYFLALAWLALNLHGARRQAADLALHLPARLTPAMRFAQDELRGRPDTTVFLPYIGSGPLEALFRDANAVFCTSPGQGRANLPLTPPHLEAALQNGGLAYYLPALPAGAGGPPQDCALPPGYRRAPAFVLAGAGGLSYTVWRLLPAGQPAPPPAEVRL